MSQNLFADVRRFALVGGSPTGRASLELSYKLVEEEVVKEFLPALRSFIESGTMHDLEEAADGAIDSIYVLIFFLNQLGLPGQQLWDEVQRANMAKFPNGEVIRNEQGKVQKPEGWQPPNLMPILLQWKEDMRDGARAN